jgi:hypothetical protein
MQPPHSYDIGGIEAAGRRYQQLLDRDYDSLDLKATVDPQMLETPLTSKSVQAATDYFADPSLGDDWSRLADEISTDSLEGRGLHEKVTRMLKGIRQTRAQLDGDFDQVREIEWSLRGELYSDQMFTDAAHDALAHLATFNASEYPYTYGIAQRVGPALEDIVGDRKRDPSATTGLTTQAKTSITDWVEGKLGPLFDGLDPDRMYSPAEVADALQQAITMLPESFRGTRWRAEVDEELLFASIRCTSVKELVSVASILPPLTGRWVGYHAVHEVLGHANRSAGGQRNHSTLATHGTVKNAQFEESLCTLMENALLPGIKRRLPGVASYLITGLALGALGTDFDRRQILSLAKDVVQTVRARAHGRDLTSEERQEATYATMNSLSKTFPGLPVSERGLADMTPLKYYFGQRKAAPLLNKVSQLGIVNEGMAWILCGKFNPYYQDDRAIVGRYHPMPEALGPFFAEQTRS